MGGGSSTARLASSTSQRTPISQATIQHGRWQFHRPSRILHVTASPRSCERRPRTGGGSSTTRLASSMSRRAPDLPSNCPSWVVAVPPPVSRLPCHGEPPISRATAHHGRWQFHRPSRVLHVTANPDLASNNPARAMAVPPPVSRPPRHDEPPILRVATQNRGW